MSKLLSVFLCITGSLVSTAATAAPILWTLDYSDPFSTLMAEGSFVYDAETDTFSDIMVSATDDFGVTNTTYSYSANWVCGGTGTCIIAPEIYLAFSDTAGPDLSGARTLAFELPSYGLPGEGGTIPVAQGLGGFSLIPAVCLTADCGTRNTLSTSIFATGELVGAPVPLPAALPLFAAGLAGLGLMRRRGRGAPAA